MLTLNFMFNVLILCLAVYWLVLIPAAFVRNKRKHVHITF